MGLNGERLKRYGGKIKKAYKGPTREERIERAIASAERAEKEKVALRAQVKEEEAWAEVQRLKERRKKLKGPGLLERGARTVSTVRKGVATVQKMQAGRPRPVARRRRTTRRVVRRQPIRRRVRRRRRAPIRRTRRRRIRRASRPRQPTLNDMLGF